MLLLLGSSTARTESTGIHGEFVGELGNGRDAAGHFHGA